MNYLTVCIDLFLQSTWTQNVGWTLLHSLWEITLIAALYAVAAVGLRNRSASLRYLIGCVAMAAMLIVPVATFFALPSPPGPPSLTKYVEIEIAVGPARTGNPDEWPPVADSQGQAATSPPITQTMFDPDFALKASDMFIVEQPALLERVTLSIRPWLPIATVGWLLGVLLLSMRPLLGCLRVQSLRRSGLTPLAESHCQLAQQLVERLGIGHVVQFAQSALVEVPTVIGYLRPMVLLPASSVTGLTTAELELILAHELAHIRRHDYALNLIQTVIEALLFYHPGMWWLSSHVRHERENCCDDVAVAISGDPATYIRALAQLEEHRIVPPALGASGSSLLMRVRRLLDQPQSEFGYRKSSIWLTALILGVSLTVAAFAGTLSGGASDEPDTTIAAVTSDQSDEVAGEPNFEKQVGQEVAQVIRNANLPFVDETRLAEIEADFAQFMSSKVLDETDKAGSSISDDQKKSILSAIKKHGAQHLAIDRYRRGDLRSINRAYLGLPDRLLTLKWKLHQAITHARSLDAIKQAKLVAQRAWMKEHIGSLSSDKFSTHEFALSELEERFADPLCCTLGYPMNDEQFGIFQQKLQKYGSKKSELRHVVSHIVQQSLFSKYPNSSEVPLPLKDRLGGVGAGRFVHLSFMSNRPFESSLRSIYDIESSGTVVDATTGYLLTAPKDSRATGDFQRWLSGREKGDFGFDDANGGSLIAIRDAKLVKLDIKTWVEADAIGNDALRALLNGPTARRTVSLKKAYQDYQQNDDAQYCYVGVLTKEGRLAVIAVEDFSDRSSAIVRTRVRAELPSMVSEKLSDKEMTISFDRPALWLINRDFPDGAGPTCSFRQPDSEVNRTLATMKVQFENNGVPTRQNVTSEPNPKATVHKILTIAGEPARLTAYPIPTSAGELMTVAFGKGTRHYQISFIYPTSQRQQYKELALAVCKSIRIGATEGEKKKASDADAAPTAPPVASLSARETVTQFLKQLAEGRKTINGKRANWDHARAYTIGEDWWSAELSKLVKEKAFQPIASLGTADRMMVLVCITRKLIYSGDSPKVGLVDLVKENGHWKVESTGVYRSETAWHMVEGFARNDDVRWKATRDDIIGQFGDMMCGSWTFSADGTWEYSKGGVIGSKGKWHLDGDVLVSECDEKVVRNHIVKFMNGGFAVDGFPASSALKPDVADEFTKMLPAKGKWHMTFSRNPYSLAKVNMAGVESAQDGDVEAIQSTSDKRNDIKKQNGKTIPDEDRASSAQIDSGWKSVAKNEWYELLEFRVSKNQSIFNSNFSKSDAQLGIGIAIDIGVLASERGFTHFRVLEATPVEKFPKLIEEIQADKKSGDDMQIVEFYAEKPDDSDQVFDAAWATQMAKLRESESEPKQLSKEGGDKSSAMPEVPRDDKLEPNWVK